MTGFQRLCLVTCGVIFVLIVIGGTVRATGSGLGCPDWPRCHGSFIPKTDKHTLIEYSHRLTASIAGLMVLAVAVWAWRSYRRVPSIFYPSLGAFALVLVQAGLGGVTVLNDLPPEIVTVHLAAALGIIALLIVVTAAAFAYERPLLRPDVTRAFTRVALFAAATAFALMLVGAYVAGAGYGLACNGWPLCNSQLIPDTSAVSVQVNFLHRILGLLLGIVVLTLAVIGWRLRSRSPLAARLSGAALAIYVAQALIGASNVWTTLGEEAVIAHLAVGTLLWVVLAVLNTRVYHLHELLPASSAGRAHQRNMAGAVR